MRAGTETALARVVAVFGAAQAHCAYLFANRRANRMKVLVHDGFGIWLAARRLNQGKFHWPGIRQGPELELNTEQLQALVLGLPMATHGQWRCAFIDFLRINSGNPGKRPVCRYLQRQRKSDELCLNPHAPL